MSCVHASNSANPPESEPPIPSPGSTSLHRESKCADRQESREQSKHAAFVRRRVLRRALLPPCHIFFRSLRQIRPRARYGKLLGFLFRSHPASQKPRFLEWFRRTKTYLAARLQAAFDRF